MKVSRYLIVLSFAVSAACATRPVFAQGLLDHALGPKAPAADGDAPGGSAAPRDAAAPKSAAAPAAAGPAAKPLDPSPEIISPDAAKKVDDSDLIRQLTQPGSDKPDPQKVEERMKAMLARMQDAANMLKERDPGDVTQETERRIVLDLDVMIELAKQQQQQGSGQGKPQDGPPQPGQKKQPGQPGPKGPNSEGGNTAATSDDSSGGQDAAVLGDMRNTGAANWGGLPPRDRDAISHGANEEYLAAYKGMIDRYYQALAEMGKTHK